MDWMPRLGFTIGYRMAPRLSGWYAERNFGGRLELSDEERLIRCVQSNQASKFHTNFNPKDQEIFSDVNRMRVHLQSGRQTFGQGSWAAGEDGKVISSNFGFRLEDIPSDLPIHLWYGKLDTNVPPLHGEETARRIGENAVLRVEEEETHASIGILRAKDVMENIVMVLQGK